MPVSTPDSPSSSTTGNMICVSHRGGVAVEVLAPPMARRQDHAREDDAERRDRSPSTSITIQNSVVASRNASFLRPAAAAR